MNRLLVLSAAGIGLAAIGAAFALSDAMHSQVALVYNATPSVPRGWYWIARSASTDAPPVGSIVLARLPPTATGFANARGYLPPRIPILKFVAAAAPQKVCVVRQTLFIDDMQVAAVKTHDGALRPLQAWPECRHLKAGELFVLGPTHPSSFDSRYFGPIPASSVIGRAHPIWTWDAR